jgi:small subunit ribosomal protein S15
MPLAKQAKQDIIGQYCAHKNDVGSSEVQVALLSQRISELTEHLKQHRKDFSSLRGMLKMVNRRRRLLRYLRNDSPERYRKVVQSLGLRG